MRQEAVAFTPSIRAVAKKEGVSAEFVRRGVAAGRICILGQSTGIGYGLAVKVNANIGASSQKDRPSYEARKARVAEKCGADTIMDLSIAGEIGEISKRIRRTVKIPVGTVPIYSAAIGVDEIADISEDLFFRAVERWARKASLITIQAGITKSCLPLIRKRRIPIVSRGGAIVAQWMAGTGKENPFFAEFDYLLELLRNYDAVLSLADCLRPGCTADALDAAQMTEIRTKGRLAKAAIGSGVSTIVEGMGHIPADKIAALVRYQKRVSGNAPLFALGPVINDGVPGYDDVSGAIGATIAAMAGADFLCAVTPAEHVRLPTTDDVREGVIAFRIAADAVRRRI